MASPTDLFLYKMIEFQHFAQLTTQSRYFSNKQNFNFEPPPLAKSWLHAYLWVCRKVKM